MAAYHVKSLSQEAGYGVESPRVSEQQPEIGAMSPCPRSTPSISPLVFWMSALITMALMALIVKRSTKAANLLGSLLCRRIHSGAMLQEERMDKLISTANFIQEDPLGGIIQEVGVVARGVAFQVKYTTEGVVLNDIK